MYFITDYNVYFIPSLIITNLHLFSYYQCKNKKLEFIRHPKYKGDTLYLLNNHFSTIHATLITIVSILGLLNIIGPSLIKYGYHYTCGYMISDLIFIYTTNYYKKQRFNFTIHHMILIIFIILKNNNWVDVNNNIIMQAFLAEKTVPTFNYCWYLIHTDRSNTFSLKLCSFLTLTNYFIFRVCNLSYLTLSLYNSGYLLTGALPGGLLASLNTYWFGKLLKKCYEIY